MSFSLEIYFGLLTHLQEVQEATTNMSDYSFSIFALYIDRKTHKILIDLFYLYEIYLVF